MDGAFVLILLCVVMLVGSYVAGMIPIVVQLSEEKLKKVSIFGAGLLVGTALTVIIPEGIRAIYSKCHEKSSSSGHSHDDPHPSANESVKPAEHADDEGQEMMIGLTLILGFIFMLIIDQVTHSLQHTQTTTGSGHRCSQVKRTLAILLKKLMGTEEEQSSGGLTATIGLVVHAAADGVALGAAASTQHKDVELIVFLAIMLHKAPAAFGLVTFLLHEGVSRRQIRKNLMLFALAAPIMTLVTFFMLGNEQKVRLDSGNGTGLAMLFSAGTFLYVSTVHVLPELSLQKRKIFLKGSVQSQLLEQSRSNNDDGDKNSENEGLLEGSSTGGNGGSAAADKSVINMDSEEFITITEQRHFRNSELLMLICGALMPLLLTLGGHHH